MGDDAELRTAWVTSVGSSAESQAAFDEVVGWHRQPHRRYHTVRHVTWVVRHLHELAADEPVDDLDAVVAAAFFHDAVYDPAANDNEEQSAALAGRMLAELGWPAARVDVVTRHVMATERHEPTDDHDTNVLIDADLAVLGTEPAAYQAYLTGVRAEYGHVDDAAWGQGRGAVVRALLARQPLYTTPTGRARWEARARANLTAELAALAP